MSDVLLVPKQEPSYIMVPVEAVQADLVTKTGTIIYVPLASTTNPGVVQVGDGLLINGDGVLSFDRSEVTIKSISKNGVLLTPDELKNIELNLSKNDVGLNNVDNTADIDKPISILQEAALYNKFDKYQGIDNFDKGVVVGADGYLKLSNNIGGRVQTYYNNDLYLDKTEIYNFSTNFDLTKSGRQVNVDIASSILTDISTLQGTLDTYGDVVTHNIDEFATSTQGAKADTALQPNDNVSKLVNDAGYLTQHQDIGVKLDKKPDGTNDLITNNKVSVLYLPDQILGQLLYGGTVNGSTGVATLTPNAKARLGVTSDTITLTNDTTAITGYGANDGVYYIVSDDGAFAGLGLLVGDWLLSVGTAWKKIDNTDAVTGIKGDKEISYRIGNVNLTPANIGALPDTTAYGKTLDVNGTIVYLKDQNGNVLSSVITQDTGITNVFGGGAESGKAIVSATYNSTNRSLTFTNGTFLTSHQDISGLMKKNNPTGTGALSLNRKANSGIGTNSVAEGYDGTASGIGAHAEGYFTSAIGEYSHAEGYNTVASGSYSHAEGYNSQSTGNYSHAEGCSVSSGDYSHAEGCQVNASHDYSHASGLATKTGAAYQFVLGKYNVGNNDSVFEIGDGNLSEYHNIFEIKTNGKVYANDKELAKVESIPTQASDIHALPDTTKYGSGLSMSIDDSYTAVTDTTNKNPAEEGWYERRGSSQNYVYILTTDTTPVSDKTYYTGPTYVISLTLKDQNNDDLGTTQTIDLPLESVVISGYYDSTNKQVILTLKDGSTIAFSVADLVSGLQTEITSTNKLNADYIESGTTNKVFTATDKTNLDNAVLFTSQTLTAEQQAQARQNIGAGSANATAVVVNGVTQSSILFDSDPQIQISNKLDKANPTGTGSLSINRKSNSTVGTYSSAVGDRCIASGSASHAEGSETFASGYTAHAEGNLSSAVGNYSHAEGLANAAQARSQHIFGEFANMDYPENNDADERGTYVEIVGNGTGVNARSDARKLDWLGNEWLAGKLQADGGFTDGNNANYELHLPDTSSWTADKTIATTDQIPTKTSDLTNDSGFLTSYTETDPTVPSWAKQENKPTYDYSEITNTPTIPISIDGLGGGTISSAVTVNGNITGQYLEGTWLKSTSATETGSWTDVWVNNSGWLYKRSKENFKSDLNIPEVVQSTGTDTSKVMSQKAITDELTAIITTLSNKFTNHSQSAYDCNTCYDEGVYLIANGSNCPSGSQYGSLFVMPYRKPTGNTKPDYCTQIYLPNGDDATAPNSMFYRTSLADAWNSWQKVATTSDIPDTSNFVTTNTAQTIEGYKTFRNGLNIGYDSIAGKDGSDNARDIVGMDLGYGNGVFLGNDSSFLYLYGGDAAPRYNNDYLALYSEIPTKTSELTNDSGFITTSSSTKESKGGFKLSNGLIVNWGTVKPQASGTAVSFAVPFTSTNYAVAGSSIANPSNQIHSLHVYTYGTSSFTCTGHYSQSNSGRTGGDITFRWIAVGY